MAVGGRIALLVRPQLILHQLVQEPQKLGKTAMDLSILGVPWARGVGHKAISQWLWASSAIYSNYSALS